MNVFHSNLKIVIREAHGPNAAQAMIAELQKNYRIVSITPVHTDHLVVYSVIAQERPAKPE